MATPIAVEINGRLGSCRPRSWPDFFAGLCPGWEIFRGFRRDLEDSHVRRISSRRAPSHPPLSRSSSRTVPPSAEGWIFRFGSLISESLLRFPRQRSTWSSRENDPLSAGAGSSRNKFIVSFHFIPDLSMERDRNPRGSFGPFAAPDAHSIFLMAITGPDVSR